MNGSGVYHLCRSWIGSISEGSDRLRLGRERFASARLVGDRTILRSRGSSGSSANRPRSTAKATEGLPVYSELLKDSVEQGRSDVTPAVSGNSRRPAIFVPPLIGDCPFDVLARIRVWQPRAVIELANVSLLIEEEHRANGQTLPRDTTEIASCLSPVHLNCIVWIPNPQRLFGISRETGRPR